jgi:hypothetical protein
VRTGTLSIRDRRPGREVDLVPSCSAEMKIEWSYTSAPPVHLYGVGQDIFTCHFMFNIVAFQSIFFYISCYFLVGKGGNDVQYISYDRRERLHIRKYFQQILEDELNVVPSNVNLFSIIGGIPLCLKIN